MNGVAIFCMMVCVLVGFQIQFLLGEDFSLYMYLQPLSDHVELIDKQRCQQTFRYLFGNFISDQMCLRRVT